MRDTQVRFAEVETCACAFKMHTIACYEDQELALLPSPSPPSRSDTTARSVLLLGHHLDLCFYIKGYAAVSLVIFFFYLLGQHANNNRVIAWPAGDFESSVQVRSMIK